MLTKPATTIRTQGRGVNTLEHQVLLLVDHIRLTSGITTPQHIHQVFTMGGQGLDGGIGKLLPTQGRMTIRLMGTNGERGIQKEHPLFCLARQITRSRDGFPKIGLNLLEDVLQRRGKLDAVLHREAQSVGLTWLVVRVLSDNHHLHLVKRTQVKGIEYQLPWRIASILRILRTNRTGEPDKIVFVELTTQILFPALFYLNVHQLISNQVLTRHV